MSEYTKALGQIVKALKPELEKHGFVKKPRKRMFHRVLDNGIKQVIEFEMGRHFVGSSNEQYGMFLVYCGVYVSDVEEYFYEEEEEKNDPSFLPSSGECTIVAGLGASIATDQPEWLNAEASEDNINLLKNNIEKDMLPFFSRFDTLEKILDVLSDYRSTGFRCNDRSSVKIIGFKILGRDEEAKALLEKDAQREISFTAGKGRWVQRFATDLGLGQLKAYDKVRARKNKS